MALTAYSPIYRGTLSDIDTRWTVISQSVDDRTPSERSGVVLHDYSSYIAKSYSKESL